jgi:hypothetical protein
MLGAVDRSPKDLVLVLADMAREHPPSSSAFVAEFARQLQGKNPALSMALSWMEQRLAEQGLAFEELVRHEGQLQTADQVSIGDSVTSLRKKARLNLRRISSEQSETSEAH